MLTWAQYGHILAYRSTDVRFYQWFDHGYSFDHRARAFNRRIP